MDKISHFDVGEVCFYGTRTVLVLNITSELSFNVYHCIDMDSGAQYRAYRYQLMKRSDVVDGMYDDDDDADMIQEQSRDDPPVTMNEVPQVPDVTEVKNDRFVRKSEDDLKAIENNTKAKTTHSQTRWGVKIFKGKL